MFRLYLKNVSMYLKMVQPVYENAQCVFSKGQYALKMEVKGKNWTEKMNRKNKIWK